MRVTIAAVVTALRWVPVTHAEPYASHAGNDCGKPIFDAHCPTNAHGESVIGDGRRAHHRITPHPGHATPARPPSKFRP
jgi:hypothetical protein